MNNKLAQLAAQRAALVNQVAYQRVQLADTFEPLSTPINWADKGLSALRFINQHPSILAGALALAVAARPNRWVRLLENGWLAWRIVLAAKGRLED